METRRYKPLCLKPQKKINRIMPMMASIWQETGPFITISVCNPAYGEENIKLALAFQREVISHIVPQVQPDLIHCNDWMAGLIPAMARQMGIPCLFTVHNVHAVKTTMAYIEDRGIDAAYFWQNLYYENTAETYEDVRDVIPADILTSGIFAAHFVNYGSRHEY